MANYPGKQILYEYGTRAELANLYNVSERTIYRWLNRAKTESGGMITPKSKRPSYDKLTSFKGTRKQLASKYNVSERTIYRWLNNSTIGAGKNIKVNSKYPGPEILAKPGTNKKLAEEYDVSTRTIYRWKNKARQETGVLPDLRKTGQWKLKRTGGYSRYELLDEETLFNQEFEDAYNPENLTAPEEIEKQPEIYEEPVEDIDQIFEVEDAEKYTGNADISESLANDLGMLDALLSDMNLYNENSRIKGMDYNLKIEYLSEYIEFQYDHHPYLRYILDKNKDSMPNVVSSIDIWGDEFETWLDTQIEMDNINI